MKRNIFSLLLIVMFFLSACTDSRSVQKEGGIDTSVQEERGEVFDDYQILNANLLDKDFLEWPGGELIEKGALAYAEEMKEEFVPTINEDIHFPEELVVMLEEILYYSGHIDMGQENSFYHTTLDKWGDNVYILDAEDYTDYYPNLYKVFQFSTDGKKDYYVFEYSHGGSNGACSVCVAEYIENEFTEINEFEIQNKGQSRVICYEGDFYYVFIQYNYNLKVRDGIRIYKLLGTEYDNLLVRYLPDEFVWKRLYHDGSKGGDAVNAEIEAYIDILKEEITSGGYIDDGTLAGMEVYYGDEEMVPDMEIDSSNVVLRPYKPIYKIDLANCSLPVFLWKTEYTPSNTATYEHLKIKFFFYDEKEQDFVELEELSKDDGLSHISLVQMWFKEICGKTYTFRLYHISDYNYMLNVVLLEKDNVAQISNYIVIPQRKFVLTEGEIFFADL